MKTLIRRTALTSIALLFLLGGASAAFASTPQTLSTTMVGGVSSLGTQIYTVSGGQTAYAVIAGQTINPSTASLKYNFIATQNGLNTKGIASLSFSGTTTGGVNVTVSGTLRRQRHRSGGRAPTGLLHELPERAPVLLPGDLLQRPGDGGGHNPDSPRDSANRITILQPVGRPDSTGVRGQLHSHRSHLHPR